MIRGPSDLCAKDQLISKSVNSSKKRTNEFVFTSMRCVFVRFLEEIEDSKKAIQNYLTFSYALVEVFQADYIQTNNYKYAMII